MAVETFKDQIREQLKATRGDKDTPQRPTFLQRASRIEVANALREFAVLINAEYPLHRALRLLGANTTNKHLASTIEQIGAQVETGAPLWQSMARHPWYFDGVTVSIARAAEASGKLGEGFGYLADLWEQDQEIRDKLGQALSYPVLLLGAFVVVVCLLLLFVVPNFGRYLGETGAKIEGTAALVYAASNFLRTPYGIPVVLILLAAPVFLLLSWKRRNEMEFDRLMGHVPVLGRLMMLADLSRFVNMMHLLVRSGIGILQGLDLAKGALGNAYLAKIVREMHSSVEQGKSTVAPLENYKDFPNRVRDMLAVGEESGKLEPMLAHLSYSMRGELLRTIDRLMVLLQPIMLILMGIVVLVTFLTFFFPYFDVLFSLSRIGTQ
jgi:type II secretory pathway component PulF